MFNKFLENILKDHPLFGVEKEDQNKAHLTGLNAPVWVHEGPVYEIFVRNFSTQGTFKSVQDKIPYLHDLGIKTIWLMPIYPIGSEDRKGTVGSPYAIRDYSKIDPLLGTAEDLKDLVKAVHQAGMKIILDIVANHMAVDSVWRNDQPKFFLRNNQGKITRKISEWSDVIDLDYSNPELQTRLKKVFCAWIENFDFDGFRCDVAGLVPTDFWEMLQKDLTKIKKDVFLLAEWESANLHPSAFHATYDWSTHFVLHDIFEGKRSAKDALTWMIEKEANYPRNALPLRFTENHDFPRTRDKFGSNSFYPFVVFNFLIYGIPLIYCGQEFGLKNTPNLFENDPLDWDKFDQQIFGFYKNLILIRKKYPAFLSRKLKNIWNDKPDQIVSILKGENESKILAILNFSQKKLDVKLDLADSYHSNQTFEDIYSGRTVSKSELEQMVIKPYDFAILKERN